jgi:hypothetical protein
MPQDVVERYQPFQLDPAVQIPFCVMEHVLSNKLLAEEVDPQHDAATRSDSLVRNDSSTCCIVLSSILWLEEFSIADYDIPQALQDAATTDRERSCLNWSFDGFMKPQILQGEKVHEYEHEILEVLWYWFEKQTKQDNPSIFPFVFKISKMGLLRLKDSEDIPRELKILTRCNNIHRMVESSKNLSLKE